MIPMWLLRRIAEVDGAIDESLLDKLRELTRDLRTVGRAHLNDEKAIRAALCDDFADEVDAMADEIAALSGRLEDLLRRAAAA